MVKKIIIQSTAGRCMTIQEWVDKNRVKPKTNYTEYPLKHGILRVFPTEFEAINHSESLRPNNDH